MSLTLSCMPSVAKTEVCQTGKSAILPTAGDFKGVISYHLLNFQNLGTFEQ